MRARHLVLNHADKIGPGLNKLLGMVAAGDRTLLFCVLYIHFFTSFVSLVSLIRINATNERMQTTIRTTPKCAWVPVLAILLLVSPLTHIKTSTHTHTHTYTHYFYSHTRSASTPLHVSLTRLLTRSLLTAHSHSQVS